MITCSTQTKPNERSGVNWEVEVGAEDVFYQGELYPSRWDQRITLWLPTPQEIGTAYLFSKEMSKAGERSKLARIGEVVIDPKTITTSVRGGDGIRGENDPCCLKAPLAVMSKANGRGRISRVHAEREGWFPDLPNLESEYEPRAAKAGVRVTIFGEEADVLHALGVLVSDQTIAVLWGDADEEPRGFEKIASLDDLRTPRFGIRDHDLLVVGTEPSNYEFRGYDEVLEAVKISDAVREALGADDGVEI